MGNLGLGLFGVFLKVWEYIYILVRNLFEIRFNIGKILDEMEIWEIKKELNWK